MLGNMIADMMIKPHQSPVFDDPKDYGLEYEDITFKTSDGVTLSGWLIKGNSDKIIIQSHFGVQCSRAGYTLEGKGIIKGYNKDIHFLNQAKYLVDAGYSVLMYDMRGHGNSENGPIPWVTWGAEEAKDVIAAVDFISNHETYKGAAIGLLSICMGQGATTNAYGLKDSLAKRENVKAMIAVQPMDYPCFVKAMGMPSFINNSALKEIKKRTGIDFNTSTWRGNVSKITVPTLVIQNKNDSYLREDLIEEYMDSLRVEKELLWIEIPKVKNPNHNRISAYEWIGKKPDEILGWFDKYVK